MITFRQGFRSIKVQGKEINLCFRNHAIFDNYSYGQKFLDDNIKEVLSKMGPLIDIQLPYNPLFPHQTIVKAVDEIGVKVQYRFFREEDLINEYLKSSLQDGESVFYQDISNDNFSLIKKIDGSIIKSSKIISDQSIEFHLKEVLAKIRIYDNFNDLSIDGDGYDELSLLQNILHKEYGMIDSNSVQYFERMEEDFSRDFSLLDQGHYQDIVLSPFLKKFYNYILKSNFKPSKLQTRPPKYFIDTSLQAKVISLRLFWKIISLQCKNIIGRQEKEITFVSGELSRYSELSNSLLNGQSPKILKDAPYEYAEAVSCSVSREAVLELSISRKNPFDFGSLI